MGYYKIVLLWLWLITSAVVIAQENKPGFGLNHLSHNSDFHLPTNISSIRDNIFPFFNAFSRLPNLIDPINPFRLKRSVENNYDKEHQEKYSVENHASHQARSTTQSSAKNPNNEHRLSVITRVTSCNYANHPGSRCLSCRESITCFRNNRAVLTRCYFILRYCNRGRCSSTPGNMCYRTTTTSTSTTSTSSSISTTTPTNNTTSTITSISSSNTISTTNITSSTSTTTPTSANTTSTTTTPVSSTSTSTVTSATSPSSSSSTSASSAASTTSGTTSTSSTSTGSSSSITSSSTT